MKSIYVISLLMILVLGYDFYQYMNPVIIQLKPGITQEHSLVDDEIGPIDLHVIIDLPMGKRIDLRIACILNHNLRGFKENISNVCFQVLSTVFFGSKEKKNEAPDALYFAPVAGLGKNTLNNHYSFQQAIEPGYIFNLKKNFNLALGIQFCGSYFNYNNGKNKGIQHFEIKRNFRFWM